VEKLVVGVETVVSTTHRTRKSSPSDMSSPPDHWSARVLIGHCPASGHMPLDVSDHICDALEPLCCRSDAAARESGRSPPSRPVFSKHQSLVATVKVPVHPMHTTVQRPITATNASVAQAMIGRVGCLRGSVQSSLPLLFLRDLASGLVPIFVVELCLISWVFYYASSILLEVLMVGSSRRLCPSHVCILLDYKTNTRKHISPIWAC
jgi:hypothetical protein